MKYKKRIISIVLLLAIILITCNYSNKTITNKAITNSNLVNENVISSLKMSDVKNEDKEIKSKSDITKVAMLINSLNILKSDIQIRTGVGYGVEIFYLDGEKDSFGFLSSTMVHNGRCYEIDKDIVGEFMNIYKEN